MTASAHLEVERAVDLVLFSAKDLVAASRIGVVRVSSHAHSGDELKAFLTVKRGRRASVHCAPWRDVAPCFTTIQAARTVQARLRQSAQVVPPAVQYCRGCPTG